MKKFLSLLMCIVLTLSCCIFASALKIPDELMELNPLFQKGQGPETNGISLDYRYYSPAKDLDDTKYPLVLWLHGMSDGTYEGKQIEKSYIAYWISEDFQARFTNGGAFVLAVRSPEETGNICWSDKYLVPLKASVDDFILKHKDNIDLSRIYVGGYSMGGKMTFKMAIAYPEMFAAAFPICPAWSPDVEYLELIKDMPIWITTGKTDPLINYYFSASKTFDKISKTSAIPEECRFTTLSKVCYPDGKRTTSAHHAWFAVNHDMFSYENGDYPHMSTVNCKGEKVTLTYPDGMISWLCSHTSNYDGKTGTGAGNLENKSNTNNIVDINGILDFFRTLFNAIKSFFSK